MTISIDCDPDTGEWFIRQFAGPLVPESFRAPDTWPDTIEVPDHVVAAYCALQVQDRSMQYLLSILDDPHRGD